jgi:hypothetical protein
MFKWIFRAIMFRLLLRFTWRIVLAMVVMMPVAWNYAQDKYREYRHKLSLAMASNDTVAPPTNPKKERRK